MVGATSRMAGHAQMKKADLASSIGAALLGGGVGVLAAQYFVPYAVPILITGAVLHAWGMLERHRLDAAAPRVWWSEGLYWLCWGILIVIGVLVLIRG
jgi:hypothetical protein